MTCKDAAGREMPSTRTLNTDAVVDAAAFRCVPADLSILDLVVYRDQSARLQPSQHTSILESHLRIDSCPATVGAVKNKDRVLFELSWYKLNIETIVFLSKSEKGECAKVVR